MIEDPSLPLPASAERAEALGGPSDLLAVAAPASARPFLLATGSSRAVGLESTGVEEVRTGTGAGSLLLVRPTLRPNGGRGGTREASATPAANVVASPGAIRRETVGPEGTVVETVLLPERLSGALLEWRLRSRSPAGLRLSFELPRPEAFRASGEHLLLRHPGEGGVRLVRVTPAPSSWRVEGAAHDEGGRPREETRVRVVALFPAARTEPAPDERRVTLLAVLAGDVERAAALLERCGRVRLHERRADEGLRRLRGSRLALRTGVGEMDDGLEWAKARMTAFATQAQDADSEAIGGTARDGRRIRDALEVLGLASLGAHAAAAERLEGLVRPGRPLGPEGWLAHAAYTSWSGRVHASVGDPGRLVDAARSLRTRAIDRGLRRAALGAVADLLDALGRRTEAETVRGRVGRAVRLPTVGSGGPEPRSVASASDGGRPGRGAEPLATAALGSGGLRGAGDAPSARALRAWTLYAADAPDEAYPLLRSHLAEAARGTPDGWVEDPLAFFLAPVAVLHGLLGARPDGPAGRLRLAPALPVSWTGLDVRNVRLGDATLDLRYTREGGTSTFVLRPTGGAVPATVVFEPRAPGPIASVRVDGDPAEVESHPAGARTAVRLQLPIDRERRVTLVGTDD